LLEQISPPLGSAAFQIKCSKCGGDLFDATELTTNQWPVAIEARCCACGSEHSVFNGSTDGYDGAVGNNQFLSNPAVRGPLTFEDGRPLESVQIAVALAYNIDPDELAEIASENCVKPVDLFDWFHLLSRTPGANAWQRSWEFECA
jgi:hypothetical protein